MRTQDGIIPRTLYASAPLLVWGVHFFYCYMFVAASCQRGSDPALGLALASVLALASAGGLTALALRRLCGGAQGLFTWVAFAIAALSLVAIAWSCLPILMMDLCAGPAANVRS